MKYIQQQNDVVISKCLKIDCDYSFERQNNLKGLLSLLGVKECSTTDFTKT
jgi:hypothetical protein